MPDSCKLPWQFAKTYPFRFYQADALQFLEERIINDECHEYDLIHASPPCQRFVTLQSMNRKQGKNVEHPDLIGPTRAALERSGRPYVIGTSMCLNVIGSPKSKDAPLTQAIICGHYLGLLNGTSMCLARHRCFESNLVIFGTPCTHRKSDRIVEIVNWHASLQLSVYGARPDGRTVVRKKEYRTTRTARGLEEARRVMGTSMCLIDWMDWDEIRQAIPPAYTEYLGRQLIGQLEVASCQKLTVVKTTT
jgi:DNA (cytosine-5)-methyltransferase 1